jgi:hypothetical protein
MLKGSRMGCAVTGKELRDDETRAFTAYTAYTANTSALRTPTHKPMNPYLVVISKVDSIVWLTI